MAFFNENGNVWLVTTHTYDDGEQFYETRVCGSYEAAKAVRDSILDEINETHRQVKGFKENPDKYDIQDEGDAFCVQTLDWEYWVEVIIEKKNILEINNEQ